ncbi:methyltransferase domain-containing protein [Granulosicoccus sp. 3-233]|uniref:methyltransferase domain-containing protein n=1 Tax=Granulosicoccus sp. 3-233 TaxID=3417969 RepID=UPI003D340BE0
MNKSIATNVENNLTGNIPKVSPAELDVAVHHSVVSKPMSCRFCGTGLQHSMVNLGLSPLCEDFLCRNELDQPEVFLPLEVLVCSECWLVQAREYCSNTEIFDDDYGYYSSYSTSWLEHASRYVDMSIPRFGLTADSLVVEIASNDGYLLKNYVDKGIPCLGIDPAGNVAAAAEKVGVSTRVEFFTDELARSMCENGEQADLIIGNNVLAHTPYINDFIAGVATLLKADGTATFEFPHLMKLIEQCQFDTIYHEHYSYYSLYTICRMFDSVDMHVVDVQRLKTAGGSLRVFLEHKALGHEATESVAEILQEEADAGLRDMSTYLAFGARAAEVKNELLSLLIQLKREGKRVIGYGAPGKGNTLLNYCGIKTDLLSSTCDRSLHKHGRFCPGSRIPIFPPEHIDEVKPDYVLILPWNLQQEITAQLAHVRDWGGKFIVPIPHPRILD